MKLQLYKHVMCLLMAFVILVPMVGCEKENKPTYDNGKYYNSKGEVMEDKDVTLDVISMIHYQKNYDELTVSKERRHVVSLYLEHHLPATNKTQLTGKNTVIDLVSGFDPSLPSVYENRLDLANGILSEASTVLSLAEIYAKFKDDSNFEKFTEKMSKTCELADVVLKFSKACYIVADLTNNDIDNKQEYCNDIIDALGLITSNVPVFDEYFTQSLEIVKTGLQEVLEKYEMRKVMYDIYEKEIDPNAQTIFTAGDEFAAMANSQMWEVGPSISKILKQKGLLSKIPAGNPYKCFRDYILWRVPYELQGGKTEAPVEPDTTVTSDIIPSNRPLCSEHNWMTKTIIKQATCMEKGIESLICKDCWATTEKLIEKAEHNYEEKVIPPTTEKMGYSVFTCKICGDYYMDKLTEQLSFMPPSINGSTIWSGNGKQEHSKNRTFKLRVDSVSKDHISGYLEVSADVLGNTKYTHQTTFSGKGQPTDEGYVYLLKFDKSVTFGVIPAYEYTELDIYYNSKKDTFTFKHMYQVTMTRT